MKGQQQDEFTEKMHREMWIDAETDLKHRVFCALNEIQDDLFPREQVLESYDVTESDITRYLQDWKNLQD